MYMSKHHVLPLKYVQGIFKKRLIDSSWNGQMSSWWKKENQSGFLGCG
jgi:hypothetical protein